jgi:glutamate---cysteine ligase / carboxylate-amine ligase
VFGVRTVGVEEEFLLLAPDGSLAPAAPDVLRLIRHSVGPEQVKPELMRFQVESASGVCRDLEHLEDELTGLREVLDEAARSLGVRFVASAVPPFADAGLTMLTDDPRYHWLAARFPTATAVAGGTCGCHVHVGVGDRDLGAQVLGRLRGWLPTLLAISGNSPLANGTDMGWDSVRYCRQLSWPTFRPPPAVLGADSYDRIVTALSASGRVLDPRNVYFLARLSPRYPTLEVRVADTCLTASDAVLLAGLVRALVTTLADDITLDRPSLVPSAAAGSVREELLTAARHGVRGTPRQSGVIATGTSVAGRLSRLIDAVLPALELAGDAGLVLAQLEERDRIGTAAQRQRALWASVSSREQFVSALARAAVSRTGSSRPARAGAEIH